MALVWMLGVIFCFLLILLWTKRARFHVLKGKKVNIPGHPDRSPPWAHESHLERIGQLQLRLEYIARYLMAIDNDSSATVNRLVDEMSDPVNFMLSGIESAATLMSDIRKEVLTHKMAPQLNVQHQPRLKRNFEVAFSELEMLVKVVERGCRRTNDIIHRLRSLTEIENHFTQKIDLVKTIDGALDFFMIEAENKNNVIRELPQLPLIYGNKKQVNYLFFHILLFSLNNFRTPFTIAASVMADGNHIIITIKSGVESHHLPSSPEDWQALAGLAIRNQWTISKVENAEDKPMLRIEVPVHGELQPRDVQ